MVKLFILINGIKRAEVKRVWLINTAQIEIGSR